jgi:hypothetical protein
MTKLHLESNIKFASAVGPAFYFCVCLAVLRLCLFFKAVFFFCGKLFTCCGNPKPRGSGWSAEWKIFFVDFFFSANEIFFFFVLLFSLFFAGSLDEPKALSAESRVW